MVENPRENLNAINRSIRDMPVTMSAFSIGIFVTPMKRVRNLGFIAWMPMDAAVPMTVAARAETRAMIRVVYRAFIISWFWNRETYHFPVKPPHFARVLALLKDRTIKVTMGE